MHLKCFQRIVLPRLRAVHKPKIFLIDQQLRILDQEQTKQQGLALLSWGPPIWWTRHREKMENPERLERMERSEKVHSVKFGHTVSRLDASSIVALRRSCLWRRASARANRMEVKAWGRNNDMASLNPELIGGDP